MPDDNSALASPYPPELHACQGLNACAGHGYPSPGTTTGSGTMPGDGYCATAKVHGCGGENNCRGQGGCGFKNDPGDNDCATLGGCGTPIPDTQVFQQDSNCGGSVWAIARKIFESRMDSLGVKYGAAGPANERRTSIPNTGDSKCPESS